MGRRPAATEGEVSYQCPACGAVFHDIFSGLEHTDRAAGNVPLRRSD